MTLFLTQARANRRLLAAVATLSDADFHVPRTSFFPSLALTLNHVLNVDHDYIAALQGDVRRRHVWTSYVPAPTALELAARQDESDERLIAFCAGLQAGDEERIVAFDRGAGMAAGPREPVGRVLAHLFMHSSFSSRRSASSRVSPNRRTICHRSGSTQSLPRWRPCWRLRS